MATSRVRGRVPAAAKTTGAKDLGELASTLAQIHKAKGMRTVIKGSETRQPRRHPTGIFLLDMGLLGGLGESRQHQYSGPRSSGKTSSALRTIAIFQRRNPDKKAVFVDVEHTFDPVWAQTLGVDLESLLLVQPSTAEEAIDLVEALLSTIEVGLIVFDSIAAMVPTTEAEQSAEDSAIPGLHAKMTTRLVRKANRVLLDQSKRDHHPLVLYLNQQRARIGGWAPPGQEALQVTGGKAMDFFITTHTKFKNHEKLGKDDDTGAESTVLNEHGFTIEKNKQNGGLRKGEFQMLREDSDDYPELSMGMLDDAVTMLAMCKRMGLYTGGGKSWTLAMPQTGDMKFGNMAEVYGMLYEDEDKYNELYWHLIADQARKQKMPDYHIEHILKDLRVCLV